MIHSALMSASLLLANSPTALATDVLYQSPPAWVSEISIPPDDAPGSATEILLFNEQVHLTAESDETFVETAVKINSPAGLAQAGNLIEAWNPVTSSLIIHRAQIIRAGKVRDLLSEGKKFAILRRESNLETSMIDGTLTATLQPDDSRADLHAQRIRDGRPDDHAGGVPRDRARVPGSRSTRGAKSPS